MSDHFIIKNEAEGGQRLPFVTSKYAGIGWRHPHYTRIIEDKPDIPWLEVHSENFMLDGGPSIATLQKARENYPISLHGVSLSLGSADGISNEHLSKLKRLIDRIDPCMVSEHISWGKIDGHYMNDLLPIPYTDEALLIMADNIDKMQSYLGRQILVENPSSYLEYDISTKTETQFINELLSKTGAGLLFDINNVYVSCQNHGWDAADYLSQIPTEKVGEIHLAGHAVVVRDGEEIRIDDHSSAVCEAVWDLYKNYIKAAGPIPTLIEWDGEIPELDILLGEAQKAEDVLQARRSPHAA